MTELDLKQIDRKTRDLNKESSRVFDNFTDRCISAWPLGNVLPVVTDTYCNVVTTPKSTLYCSNIEAQALFCPTHVATGLLISGDLVDTNGFEINLQEPGQADARFNFTIGETPFFIEAKFTVADVTWAGELLLWFRKSAAFAKARASYTDYALVGNVAGDLKIATMLNNGWETLLDTTNNMSDGASIVFRVEVDSEGKVKFFTNQKTDGTYDTSGTLYKFIRSTEQFTFDSADVVVPCIRMIQATVAPGLVTMNYLQCGYMD